MAKLSIVAGATSQSVNIFIQDTRSLTGAGLSGLVFNASGLTAYYSFSGAAAGSNVIALATLAAVNSAYSSGGFKEIDATNMTGWYRFDIPTAVLVAGNGRSVGVHLQGAANMAPCPLEIELTGVDNQNATTGGMSALPNIASGSAGAIPTTGTGANQIQVNGSGGVSHVVLTDTVTTYTGNTPQTGDAFARIGATGSGLTFLAPASTALSSAAMMESYAANGAAPTPYQAIYQVLALLENVSISGTTLTAFKLDGATSAMTFTLNSATNPTSRLRAT